MSTRVFPWLNVSGAHVCIVACARAACIREVVTAFACVMRMCMCACDRQVSCHLRPFSRSGGWRHASETESSSGPHGKHLMNGAVRNASVRLRSYRSPKLCVQIKSGSGARAYAYIYGDNE